MYKRPKGSIESENRKPNNPKRSKKYSKNKFINISIGIFAFFCISFVLLTYFNNTYIYSNNISRNIFIEGIDVSNMTKKEAIEAVSNLKKPKSINLAYDDKKYVINPSDINLTYNILESVNQAYDYGKEGTYLENVKKHFNLKRNPKDIKLKSSYDEALLSNELDKISKEINVDKINAKIYISDSGNISYTPSSIGKEVDIANLKENIYNKIENKNYDDINLKVDLKEPSIDTKDVRSINTLLAEYSTKFSTGPGHEGRNENIKIASDRTSDVLLMPGEEFSYNNLTGPRNKANGYKDAGVIINGKIEQGTGGGVCQVSSTIYNSVLYSGLELTSRKNHSLKSTYVPIGRDATVTDGGIDLRFKNQYSNPIYIKNTVYNGVVTSKIYGNSKDKKNIDIKVDSFEENGLDAAKTYRVYKDQSGNILKEEYISKSIYKKPNKN